MRKAILYLFFISCLMGVVFFAFAVGTNLAQDQEHPPEPPKTPGEPAGPWGREPQPPGSGNTSVDQRFLGHFTTGTGEPSIDIEPSDREGEVRVLIRRAFGGSGNGDLLGGISADGQLRATGRFSFCTLFGGCSNWMCNLTGVIKDNRLTGNYELVAVSGSGTIIGDVWEKGPSGNQKGIFDLQKFVPAYTPRQ